VELPIEFDHKPIEISFDPKFVLDMLKVLEPDAAVTLEITDDKVPAVFQQDSNYTYVVVPLVTAGT
jgi:DNA polymerase-3 subunit beta